MVLGQPIATAAQMRAADAATIADGAAGAELMDRAGRAVARAIAAFCGPDPVLVLCGPGNNGGDGYVVARELAVRGWPVSVARLAPPKTRDAIAMAALYTGTITSIAEAHPAPILVDALFGTGQERPLDARLAARLEALMAAADVCVAVDLPSGVDADSGALLGAARAHHLTVALGALKPAHVLYPAAALCGRIVVADIGIRVATDCCRIEAPLLPPPGFADHKYTRGYVFVAGGAMPGASALSARAAQAAGAGYVMLARAEGGSPLPASIIERQAEPQALEAMLEDERIGAVVIGPGLGRDGPASQRLDAVLDSGRALVLDADALILLGGDALPVARRLHGRPAVLTPHEGEFTRLFGDLGGSKIDRARAAAKTAGAVVVLKGPDTVVAAPDGRAAIAGRTSFWLSTAGTGDVLAGVIAAMLARGLPPFEAATAGVWLHGDAACRAGPALGADDLVPALKAAYADLTCPN